MSGLPQKSRYNSVVGKILSLRQDGDKLFLRVAQGQKVELPVGNTFSKYCKPILELLPQDLHTEAKNMARRMWFGGYTVALDWRDIVGEDGHIRAAFGGFGIIGDLIVGCGAAVSTIQNKRDWRLPHLQLMPEAPDIVATSYNGLAAGGSAEARQAVLQQLREAFCLGDS